MPRLLTAHTATVSTASVEIKTLSVAGKQVSLALFRQIVEKPIFDFNTGQLRGVGWGHVRYLMPDGSSPQEAINLVWQEGDELRRCLLRRHLQPDWTPQRAADFCENPFAYRGYSSAEYSVLWIDTEWGEYAVPKSLRGFRQPHPYALDDLQKHKNKQAVEEYIANVRVALKPIFSHVLKIHEAYDNCVGPLFDLPHLFIAV